MWWIRYRRPIILVVAIMLVGAYVLVFTLAKKAMDTESVLFAFASLLTAFDARYLYKTTRKLLQSRDM